MTNKIVFTKTIGAVSDDYIPVPSSSCLPEWYKKTQSYVGNAKTPDSLGMTNATIKKCIPVFDILTSGYIIPTYCDLFVKKNQDGFLEYIPSDNTLGAISFHATVQAPYHPNMNNYPYPKFSNPWSIKTPPGWSCLFLPPVHSTNSFFTILEGFVDTDKYSAPVNFPFVLNDINFEGLIPAGTPMAQVIPVKRESWKMVIGDEKNINESNSITNKLNSKMFDRYKTIWWNKKEYK